jgi:hypothetical protein
MSKEYIIHGTPKKNIIKILKSGYIDPNPEHHAMLHNNNPKQIFTQLIFKSTRKYNIYKQSIQIPHFFNACVVLKKKILKDLPFYSVGIGRFYNTFRKGIKSGNNIIYGKGKLPKIPNVNKLKKHITNFKSPEVINFMYSHEILFNRKIYLKKYCDCIIIMQTNIKENNQDNIKETMQIENLAKEKGIQLKYQKFNFGINKFVNLIES